MLKTALLSCKKQFIFVAACSFVINILMLALPLYMLMLFTRVIVNNNTHALFYMTLTAGLAFVLMALFDMARSRLLVRVSQQIAHQLTPEALRLSLKRQCHGQKYGTQALLDITKIRAFFSGSSLITLTDIPWVPVFISVIYYLHPLLGYISMAGALILFTFAMINEIMTRKYISVANHLSVSNKHSIESAFNNAEVIQSMGMEKNIIGNWLQDNEKVSVLETAANHRSGVLMSIVKFFRYSLQIGVLGTGAWLVIQNQLNPGYMIVAAILMARALIPVEQGIMVWNQFVSMKDAYHRLKAHFTLAEGSKKIRNEWPTAASLELNNISYRYPGSENNVLDELSFTLNPGEIIAIIGASGSGKSTLARTLVGILQPTRGNVLLNEKLGPESVANHIGYLPQNVELFSGTIPENIARMGTVNEDKVSAAAKLAGLEDKILQLDNISRLSGGQRQRVALARALYDEPKLIVLDEPNASLDREGEQALLSALLTMRERNCLIVVITHRSLLLKQVDRVAVINHGRLTSLSSDEMITEQPLWLADRG